MKARVRQSLADLPHQTQEGPLAPEAAGQQHVVGLALRPRELAIRQPRRQPDGNQVYVARQRDPDVFPRDGRHEPVDLVPEDVLPTQVLAVFAEEAPQLER